MNTVTVILIALGAILNLVVLWLLLRSAIRAERNSPQYWSLIVGLIAYIIVTALTIVAGLNVYGVARLPVLNEMNRRLPETYVEPETIKPPTQGSTQPSSQPTFDEHKQRMDKLKKDGF